MSARRTLATLVTAAVLGAPAASAAQLAGAGTGSIVGIVKDSTGAPMTDVLVVISGRPLMGAQTTAS